MFCPACGVQLPKIARFCMNCGMTLTASAPPAVAAPPALRVDMNLVVKDVRARFARFANPNVGIAAAPTPEEEQRLKAIVRKLPATFTAGFRIYWELAESVNKLSLVVLGLAPFLLQIPGKSRLIYLATDSDMLRQGWEICQSTGGAVSMEFASWEDVGTAIYQRHAGENAWLLGDVDWRAEPITQNSMHALIKAATNQPNTAAIFIHQIGRIAAVNLPIRI